jgi:hypothetical protein
VTTKAIQQTINNPTMLKTALIVLLLVMFWEPIRPARVVTGEALHTIARLVAK